MEWDDVEVWAENHWWVDRNSAAPPHTTEQNYLGLQIEGGEQAKRAPWAAHACFGRWTSPEDA